MDITRLGAGAEIEPEQTMAGKVYAVHSGEIYMRLDLKTEQGKPAFVNLADGEISSVSYGSARPVHALLIVHDMLKVEK